MSGIRDEVKEHMENTFTSGQPGTTGREPFERPVGDHEHHLGQHGHQHGTSTGGAAASGLTGAGISGSHHGTAPGAGGVGSEVSGSHSSTGLTGSHHTGTGSTTQNLENEARSFATGTHGHHSHESQGHIGGVGSRTAGAGAGVSGGAEDYVRSHGGAKNDPAIDDYNRGATDSGVTGSRDTGDRTGNLNQGGALYERSTDQGPATSGAAGTDRFDSDRHHSSTRDTTGSSGPGFTDTAARTGVSGHTGQSETSRAVEASGANKDGGGLSALTTTDDEFTGKDRSHKAGNLGAYADTEGPFQGNTSGPGGNTALTGREGNPENNPVARAKSSGETIGDAPSGTSTRPGVDETATGTEHAEKKGIFEKIKEVL
ncbi:hypothetical protein I317_03379 [Kwoniella heveanensis CBS 569]|nr:hypothetical protein I317_03379 [Kwoniella heveanensis CBS 569]